MRQHLPRRPIVITIVLACSLSVAAPFQVSADDSLTARGSISPSLSFSGKSTHSGTAITDNLTLSSGLTNRLLSQPPMLTRRYTLHGQTVMPYIGAGFGGGETTDPNRTIVREGAVQEDRILHEPLSKALAPNEFQLGVRIPF